MRRLLASVRDGTAWPCGTAQLVPRTAEEIAEWMLQLDDDMLGKCWVAIHRFRNSFVRRVHDAYYKKFRFQLRAIENRVSKYGHQSGQKVIITQDGVVMG